MDIGERIKFLRKTNKWTQTELGEKIGLSYGAVASIESGRNDPSSETTIKLSGIFGVSADYLLTGKEGTNEINEDEREILEIMRKDSDFSEAVKKAAGLKKKVINYLDSYRSVDKHATI